jgi:hypothetical protein
LRKAVGSVVDENRDAKNASTSEDKQMQWPKQWPMQYQETCRHGDSSLAFVDWQEAKVQGERQKRHARRDRRTVVAIEMAIATLFFLEFADEGFVPLFPCVDVRLE